MYKYTFERINADWANAIAWSAIWQTDISESLLSIDKSKIYSFFIFGSSVNYLHFASFSVSSGSIIDTRYKSSGSITKVEGSAQNGNYILVTLSDNTLYYVLTLNTASFTFNLEKYSASIFGWGVDASSGR